MITKRSNSNYNINFFSDGQVKLYDSKTNTSPVDLPLEQVLGKMPPKTFTFTHEQPVLKPLELPQGATVADHLGTN